jgi:hypothetical protein
MDLSNLSAEELQTMVKDKAADNDGLLKQLGEKDAKILELEKDNKVLSEKNESLSVELDKAVKVNADLSALVESEPAEVTEEEAEPAPSFGSFEVDGKSHDIVFKKIHHKGVTITAEEVLASENLQKELVAMGSGMVR